jgi:spore maturation protein CgeB/glycosyltransferase involved in cell wall biosynthesis
MISGGEDMKVLFTAIQYDYNDSNRGYSFEYENFYKALKSMKNVELIYFDTCDFWSEEKRKEINSKLIELVEQEKPDILFNFFYRDQISKETFLYLKNNTSTILVNWFADDHWRFDGSANPSKEWCWCFDYCVTTDQAAIQKYYSIGYHNIILSQWGCNHQDYIKKNISYKYDVSFVGQPHGNRRQVIEYLRSRGIQVHCFGYGWDEREPNKTRVTQSEMVNIFNQSKINLNLSNSSDLSAPQQIKGRNFEVPSCGGFLLTSEVEGLDNYYRDGKELVCYHSSEDMAEKILYYLNHESERVKIQNAGYQKTLQQHTYESRFNSIFNEALQEKKVVKGMEFNIDILLNSNGDNKIANSQKVAIFTQNKEFLSNKDFLGQLQKNYSLTCIFEDNWLEIEKTVSDGNVCYFTEVTDALVLVSRLKNIHEKKILCRIPPHQVDSPLLQRINWHAITGVQCSSEADKYYLHTKLNISERKIFVVPIGINISRFKNRKPGYNIAYYDAINFEKGSMLLLQLFKKIVDKNSKYKLYIAGNFYDMRDILYYQQMIAEMGLQNNIIVDNVETIDFTQWLENKNYFLCTCQIQPEYSNILKAMGMGIKPIIHNFVGAAEIFPRNYLWTDLSQALKMILEEGYQSAEYKNFIDTRYSAKTEGEKISRVIDIISYPEKYEKDLPLVTVGITNYNYGKFIEQCMESVATQSYKNIEVLVIDDCSKDDSAEKIKSYEKKYKNIRGIFNNPNSGSGVLTIQQVIKEAKGEFVKIIDADDYYGSNDVIEQYVNAFVLNPEVDYIYANRQVVDVEGNKKEIWTYSDWGDNEIIHQIFSRLASGVIPMYGMYRTDFYRRNKTNWSYVEDVKVCYDTLHCIMNVQRGFKRKYINKTLLNYRQHGNNITQSVATRIKSHAIVLEYIIGNFNEEVYMPQYNWSDMDKDARAAFKAFVLGNYYAEFYKMYYNDKWKPWDFECKIQIEEMVQYLQPIKVLIDKYFEQCKAITSQYNQNIDAISMEFAKMMPQKKVDFMNSCKTDEHTVFIGLPVYNGERFIKEAIDSLINQTYKNWTLFISDNDSNDKTSQIAREYCQLDSRIHYYKQSKNIGAANNFKFVLDACHCKYFMWAACDDVWHKDFIKCGVEKLLNSDVGMVFSNIVNVDSFGRTIRRYEDFSKFCVKDRLKSINNFLNDPEILGKANLIYGIFKVEVCKSAYEIAPLDDSWGSDVCFVYAVLSRTEIFINKEILYFKRRVRESDEIQKIDYISIDNPEDHIFPLQQAHRYIKNMLRAAEGTEYYSITADIMLDRLGMLINRYFTYS